MWCETHHKIPESPASRGFRMFGLMPCEAVHIIITVYPSVYLFKMATSKGTQNGRKALPDVA